MISKCYETHPEYSFNMIFYIVDVGDIDHVHLFYWLSFFNQIESTDVPLEATSTDPDFVDHVPSSSQQDDEVYIKTPISEKQSAHLNYLNKLNEKQREINAEKQKRVDAHMKNVRQGKIDKASRKESSDSKEPENLFDSDDDVQKLNIGSDDEIQNLPDSQLQNLITVEIPSSKVNSNPSQILSPLSSRPLKPLNDLSRSQQYQREKLVQQKVTEAFGPGYTVTTKPVLQKSVHEAAKRKVLNNIDDVTYGDLDRAVYPCLTLVKQYLKDLTEKLQDQRKDGLAQFIINDINSLEDFPFEKARINFGIDEGGGVIKFVIAYVDRENSQSVKKLRVYKAIYGKESRKALQEYLEEIDVAAAFLQHAPIETKHGLKIFECFMIADCKCGDLVIGIQGGSATRPCLYCKIKSSDWKSLISIPVSEMRTVEEIKQSGLIIEEAAKDETLSDTKLRNLMKQHNSVNATPLITAIPLNRFVPDAVHINMSAVNSILEHCRKNKESGAVLLAETDQLKLPTEAGRSEYNGPNCRKILKHFVDNSNIEGYGIDLLRSFAKVEAYAVARDLTEEEIDGLDEAIKDFFTIIDTNYPDLPGKKTKLHMLKFHVVPFVREYKSWGKFSAQALEGSHKVKNQVDIKMPGKSPAVRSKQMDYFMNRQMLLNYFTNETH